MLKLYGYWRSSATYRVRIALNLKNISYEYIPIHLLKNGGEQHQSKYLTLNPSQLVPTLLDEERGIQLSQSLAIIEYLDDAFPEMPCLIPTDPLTKYQVKSLSLDIACDIQPLANLRVLQYLKSSCKVSDNEHESWSRYWIELGFQAIEKKLGNTAIDFCFGNQLSMADICLIPQVYNARRCKVDLTKFPVINAIDKRCNGLAAFECAKPENQIDAQ